MAGERRNPAPPQETENAGERLSPALLYPLIGAGLGICSPVGAFLLRFWLADPLIKGLWMRSELSYNSLFYWYMGVGTVSSFIAFGFWLGFKSERQLGRNKALRRRIEELRVSSVTDGLTGAFSHAYLQENLQLELDRSRRRKSPLSVIMIDLDNFKKINDTHGHLFGDRVLQEVTETLSMNIRQGDVLGRYGGEEFMVLMPSADAGTAMRVAERIRQAVGRTEIVDSGEPGAHPAAAGRVHITLSLGVATYPGEGEESGPSFIKRADQCLYRAKREGKDRVRA